MQIKTTVKLIFPLWLLFTTWGCNPGGVKNTTDSSTPPASTSITNQHPLTRAIVFKSAADIQYRLQVLKFPNPEDAGEDGHFLLFLNNAARSKQTITESAAGAFKKDSRYAQLAHRILRSDGSHWTIKKLLDQNNIPHQIKIDNTLLLNPYIYLPLPVDTAALNDTTKIRTLWNLFYTAVMLEENPLLEIVYPLLLKQVSEKYPAESDVFKNIYRIHKGKLSPPFDAASLACYYLITGNLDENVTLSETAAQTLRRVIDHYNDNFYSTNYITVNRYTLENRFYMWLAARQEEQAGNIDKANVFIKTTFDNEVLRNLENFHPNNQVYLYTTVRLALQVHSPAMYRYVIGAIEPLTKLNETTFKALLKTQLLQLIQ